MKRWKIVLTAMLLAASMSAETIPVCAEENENDGQNLSSEQTAVSAESSAASAMKGTEISSYVLSSDLSAAGDPVTTPPQVQETEYTKISHYTSDVTFSGVYKTNTFSFEQEDYWDVRYAYAEIEFSVSPLITDEVPATLTFSVNNTPVTSCRIDYALGETQTAYVQIPTDLLKDGYNNLSVTGYVLLYDEEGCLDDFTNANWICVSKDSLVQIGYDVTDTKNSIQYFPFPLLSSDDASGKDCGIYIPDDASSDELTAAMMLRARLGEETEEEDDITLAKLSKMSGRNQRVIVAEEKNLPEEVKKRIPDTAGDGSSFDLSKGALVFEYSDDSGTVLVVTAENGKDLSEGASMLMDDDRLKQEKNASAFVPSGTAAEVIKQRDLSDLIVKEQTITGITNEEGLVFIGPFRQEQTIFLPLSGGFVLGEGGKISLNFRYSDNLDFDRSLITIYWGDTPVASKKLEKKNAGGDSFSFNLPSDAAGTYASSIRIAFDLEIKDLYCTKRTDEMPWAYVSGDSELYLPVGNSTDYSLTLRPYPFQTLGVFNDTALVLPDSYTDKELDLAGSVMSLMGNSVSPYGSFEAVKASDYDTGEDSNLITIGTYQDNSVIRDLNKNLSFFYQDDGKTFASNSQLVVSEDYGKRVGILQIIRSPYAGGRAVMTVSAADENGIENIADYIRIQENTWELSGDAFLIDSDGETSSYTFLDHEASDTVSLKEEIKKNKNAILFTIIGSSAMLILFIGVVIMLAHYRRHRKEEKK